MKIIQKMTLAGVTTALFTAGALANDAEWHAIDNHHGVITYSRAAQNEMPMEQRQTTVAVYTNGRAIGRASASVESNAITYRQVSTPQGPITYTAPAE
jgi:hypothetical protein